MAPWKKQHQGPSQMLTPSLTCTHTAPSCLGVCVEGPKGSPTHTVRKVLWLSPQRNMGAVFVEGEGEYCLTSSPARVVCGLNLSSPQPACNASGGPGLLGHTGPNPIPAQTSQWETGE